MRKEVTPISTGFPTKKTNPKRTQFKANFTLPNLTLPYGRKNLWQPEKSTYKGQMHPFACYSQAQACKWIDYTLQLGGII